MKARVENAVTSIGKYFEFEMITTYLEGEGNNNTYNPEDYKKRKTYKLTDFTLDENDLVYVLNIAEDVALMGDFNNMNLTQMKQYVDFNINIDWI